MIIWPFAAAARHQDPHSDILAELLEAWENGLWCFVVCKDEIVCLERPAIHTRGGQLHREDGSAISWPGEEYYFWRGVNIRDAYIITNPEKITVKDIDGERNAEIKRIMVERYGYERFMKDAGGKKVQEDNCGILWSRPLAAREFITLVEVVNGTPEPDGSIKHYWLRVPPTVRTAREAVAWTYGLTEKEYKPKIRT